MQVRELIELAAKGIEVLAVAIMVAFIVIGTIRWVFHSVTKIAGAMSGTVCIGQNVAGRLELLVAAISFALWRWIRHRSL